MSLLAISPVDGRYNNKCEELNAYFSEHALFKYRIFVEIEYFIALSKFLPDQLHINEQEIETLRQIVNNFSPAETIKIKEIEKITNHDVKAVEYYIKDQIKGTGLERHAEYIHFGLTSQDINNTAIPISIKDAIEQVMVPQLKSILQLIFGWVEKTISVPMLARTHGQPATPTTMGKEWSVFHERLEKQIQQLMDLPIEGKFGGASGNFNAHLFAFPNKDWIQFANDFLNHQFGLTRQKTTTQIEHYDQLAALLQNMIRINTILIDFCRDIWTYISMDYFKQKVVSGEVGSSAMPHKVNPIDFENAEGNLGLSNAIADHMALKLPISRLQRDLTDSTVLRNIGMPFAYQLIALKSIQKGISKLELNSVKIKEDLNQHWPVLAEAIQSLLRSIGYPEPYEKLKELTRGNQQINKETLAVFISKLEIDDIYKDKLMNLSPDSYLGYSDKLNNIE